MPAVSATTTSIDLSKESLSEGVMRLTDGAGVDVALDSIGGDITGEALKSLAPGGRVIQMGYPAGTALTVEFDHADLGRPRAGLDERPGLQHLLPATRSVGRMRGGRSSRY